MEGDFLAICVSTQHLPTLLRQIRSPLIGQDTLWVIGSQSECRSKWIEKLGPRESLVVDGWRKAVIDDVTLVRELPNLNKRSFSQRTLICKILISLASMMNDTLSLDYLLSYPDISVLGCSQKPSRFICQVHARNPSCMGCHVSYQSSAQQGVNADNAIAEPSYQNAWGKKGLRSRWKWTFTTIAKKIPKGLNSIVRGDWQNLSIKLNLHFTIFQNFAVETECCDREAIWRGFDVV